MQLNLVLRGREVGGIHANFSRPALFIRDNLLIQDHVIDAAHGSGVTVWGTGTPRREFLHVDDLAEAVLYLLHTYDAEPIMNVGWGQDVTIRELAKLVMSAIGYTGRMIFDTTKPDGTPRKSLDVTRLTSLGWRPRISLKDSIEQTYAWFKEHSVEARL